MRGDALASRPTNAGRRTPARVGCARGLQTSEGERADGHWSEWCRVPVDLPAVEHQPPGFLRNPRGPAVELDAAVSLEAIQRQEPRTNLRTKSGLPSTWRQPLKPAPKIQPSISASARQQLLHGLFDRHHLPIALGLDVSRDVQVVRERNEPEQGKGDDSGAHPGILAAAR